MGWTSYPYDQKPSGKEITDEIVRSLTTQDCRIIDQSGLLNHGRHQFFLLEECPKDPEPAALPLRFVVLMLIEYRGGELFLKKVEESMGPLELDCPMRIMKALEGHRPLNEFSANWRHKVLEYHSSTAPKKSVLRQLRNNYPGGENRLVLSTGDVVTYEQGSYRRKRNVSAYWDPKANRLTLLRPMDIDAEATRRLWDDPEHEEQPEPSAVPQTA